MLHFLFDPDAQKEADLAFPFVGTTYPGSTRYSIDYNAFFYGAYERQWLRFCLGKLPDPRTAIMLDIGGNVGHHALWFAAQGCTVHSFEPNPALWPEIERKAALDLLPGSIILHRTALGASDETLPFNLPSGANQGTGSFEHKSGNWSGEQMDLEISGASAYLQSAGITGAALIKIDVEGFEKRVMTGLASFLATASPIVWVEISARNPAHRIHMNFLREALGPDYRYYHAERVLPFLTWMRFHETDRIPDVDTIDIIAVPVS